MGPEVPQSERKADQEVVLVQQEYKRGSSSASEISDAVRNMLSNHQNDDELRQALGNEEVRVDSISITYGSSNLDPATATLIVTFAGPVFFDVWHRIVLPRLERALGNKSLGPQVNPEEESDER